MIDVGVVSARRGSYLAAALYSASVARWEVCRRVLSMLVVVGCFHGGNAVYTKFNIFPKKEFDYGIIRTKVK